MARAGDGALHLDANAVGQVAGTRLCGYDGELVEEGASQAIGRTLIEDLEILRNGPLREVVNDFCDETGPAISGSMKGLYFRIGVDG